MHFALIRTTVPGAKLEVAGNILADGVWIQIASATLSGVAMYTFNLLNGNRQKTYRVVVQGYLTEPERRSTAEPS